MDFKTILEKYQNDEGMININDVDFRDIDNSYNQEVGKLLKQQRDKERSKLDKKVEQEVQQVKQQAEQTNNEVINELLEKVNAMETTMKLEKKEKENIAFKNRASKLNIDNDIVDLLISSGANVSDITDDQLKTFNRVDVKVESTETEQDKNDNQQADAGREAHIKAEAQKIIDKIKLKKN